MSNAKKVTVETENMENVLPHDEAQADDQPAVEEVVGEPELVDYVEISVNEEDDQVLVEDLDENEEIWSGGPTAKMIVDWKEQYGDVYVTSVTYENHVVWRVLNRLEYKNIVKQMETFVQEGQMTSAEANMWNEEAIANTCILYPAMDSGELTGSMAGVPSLISQEVLEASGFVALEVRQL